MLASATHRLLIAALAALCTVAVSAPWSAPGATFIAAALLGAPALVATLVLAAPLRALLDRVRGRRLSVGSALGLLVARDLSLAGVFAICDHVADAPDGRHALCAHALVVLLAGCAGVVARRLTRRVRFGFSLAAYLAVFVLTGAIELGLADAITLPREHVVVHEVLLVATLVAFVAGWTLVVGAARFRRPLAFAGAIALAAFAWSAARVQGPRWPALMATRAPSQRIVSLARQLLDRDGDGFSAALGGGDCDDDDPTAFPLSTVGRDCLGWSGSPSAEPMRLPRAAARPSDPPAIVVLVSIDAFRCGFGVREAAPLRDACPSLTRLAREGWARLDAHANFPATARSMTAMNTGDLFANPARPVPRRELATEYAANGYATVAVITHPYAIADAGVRASFAVVDESLEPAAMARSGVTADRVTDRVLEHLASVEGPAFVWAHYFDPHAPYVRTGGDVWTDDDEATYALEVRRTDAAIGRLADALAHGRDAARTVLFVTADHGEAFGEHGVRHHGRDLHDEVMRVPMIAWTAGPTHRALTDGRLPASTVGVAAYLERLLTGALPPEEGPVYERIAAEDDTQLAVIDRGWKLIYHRHLGYLELYDLKHDPNEELEVASANPAVVSRLGGDVASFHRALFERRKRELDQLNVAHARR